MFSDERNAAALNLRSFSACLVSLHQRFVLAGWKQIIRIIEVKNSWKKTALANICKDPDTKNRAVTEQPCCYITLTSLTLGTSADGGQRRLLEACFLLLAQKHCQRSLLSR